MTVPDEFTPQYLRKAGAPDQPAYASFWQSGEPYKSIVANNPWMKPPKPGEPLVFDGTRYWDTTCASRHPYWRDKALPRACKGLSTLRHDLYEWGYCLIKDGLSSGQCRTFLDRLVDQAAGERLAGVDQPTPSGQYVNTLINKGDCFRLCIEHDPRAVQAGPLIEHLLNETLGNDWICHSFLANGADPGGYPQGLHIDQGPLLPLQTGVPALVNTMFIPQDVDETNGGTLLIPGSHKIMANAGSGGAIGALPPAINLQAKAGTIMLFDGRMLHGTGANRTNKQRFVATMSSVKSWMRQQENWIISTRSDILAGASDKLKHRLGLQALTYGATVEGVGLGARGYAGDAMGDVSGFRKAMDAGTYLPVGELSADSKAAELEAAYTVKHIRAKARKKRGEKQ